MKRSTTCETRPRWEDNIKMDHKETVCDDVDRIHSGKRQHDRKIRVLSKEGRKKISRADPFQWGGSSSELEKHKSKS
jgi:hypothetical protein